MTRERSPDGGLRWGGTRVVDPSGAEWVVRRRWVQRRLRWRGRGLCSLDFLDGAELAAQGGDLPVVGVILLGVALLLLAVGLVLLVVPALIFVAELSLVVLVVAIGLVARLLFGRPWTVEARRVEDGTVHQWRVVGWRASRDLVGTVAERLQAAGVPPAGLA